ncbi:MAG TPA: hypothetical protein VGQ23_16915 [Burkholderiaceae bacterium]|jgi:hypothetical protein|nr:hypothetical protein [Burkholderiaceae bacterium]
MARTSKPATAKTARRTPASAAEPKPATDAAVADPFDAARTMIDNSMNASLSMLRMFEQMQQQQAQALKGVEPAKPAKLAANDEAVNGLQDLIGLQVTFAAEQFANMAQLSNQMFASVLDVERQWLEQWQSGAADLARGWIASNGALASPATRRALELPTDTSPIGLFNNTQAAFAEMTKVWLDAVTHDTQHA